MFTEYPEITGIDNINVSLKKHHILSTICYIEQFLRETETPRKQNEARPKAFTGLCHKMLFLIEVFFPLCDKQDFYL